MGPIGLEKLAIRLCLAEFARWLSMHGDELFSLQVPLYLR
jgi:hypothetical protein